MIVSRNMIIVTGGNGQLGKTLKTLNNFHKIKSFSKKQLDITKKNDLIKKIKKLNPSIIINTASFTDVNKSQKNYSLAKSVNFLGIKNLVLICKLMNILLIHISTDYVFFGNKKTSYSESDACIPKNNYGKSKLLGELYIKKNLDKFFIFRVSWLFGYGKNNFVYKIINLIKNKEKIKIVDNEYSSPTSAEDLVNLLSKVITMYNNNYKLKYGTYHFNSLNKKISRYQFAIKIKKILKKNKITNQKIIKVRNEKSFRPINSFLNTGKIYNEFNLKRNNFDNLLNSMIEYYLKNEII